MFVSFAPPSFFTAVLGMAILYIPCLILLVASSGANASFSVLLRRDYGPLLTCGLMAWAAAHLPGAKLETVPGAGHSVYFEKPAEFNALLDRFLATLRF